MPTVGPYKVSIVAGGQVLPEYDPSEDDADANNDTTTRYIEVIAGLDFHVEFSVQPYTEFPTGFKDVDVNIDGQFADSFVLDKQKHGSITNGWTRQRDGRSFYEGGRWVRKPLVFQNLVTTEETLSAKDLKTIAEDIGSIRIRIHDVVRERSDVDSFRPTKMSRSIPEKALKGQPIDMSAEYGSATPSQRPRVYTSTRVGEVLATCIYKYRSRRALQLLELIPATPEPQPLEERDIDTLDPQEMRQLLAQYREHGSQSTRVKEESDHTEENSTRSSADSSAASSMSSRKRPSSASDNDDDECILVEVKKRRVVKQEIDVLDLT
ncbi:hypothetical protein OHC33_002681 [Knufia fluminis]|uniref:DUF7918 domain-containing protein n=1 Tax=Knufia fluminis TaxID=191047 RepID=A0AAN8EPQ9_9EURO|nr:hypothetical protein OHC33_002681 [Knufia fluminis]